MTDAIHVFAYGAHAESGVSSEKVRDATVPGTLFEVEGIGPALMLSGPSAVRGEVRRIAIDSLEELDARARVREGLYRRVGVQVGETACWAWVAGPALAPRLATLPRHRGGEGA